MKTIRITIDPHAIDQASIAHGAQIIRDGGLVAMPTETVYGLAGNALDLRAVAAIFQAKGRPTSDPLIVHVADMVDLSAICAMPLPVHFDQLTAHFWPGPLTLLVPKHPQLSDLITAGHPTVAVRMPAHPVATALIRASGVPLVAPSANLFSRPSPTSADHVLHDLAGRIDAVIDAGPTRVGVESTILDITSSPPRILRQGGITRAQIEAVIGLVTIHTQHAAHDTAVMAPGLLLKHYSPRTPLRLYRGPVADVQQAIVAFCHTHPHMRIAWLGYAHDAHMATTLGVQFVSLGDISDDERVAHHLFEGLRAVDLLQADVIVTSEPLGTGIAAAVRDRLFRAAEGRVIEAPATN
jgi:L-threonylcarbamoyladenylate synthase